MNWKTIGITVCLVLVAAFSAMADEPAAGVSIHKHQVTGLFAKSREQDLRDLVAQIPGLTLKEIDFVTAEVSLEYDAEKQFPGAKPEQIVERLDAQFRDRSRHTFGVKALCALPADKLQQVEIPVVGLDCKACCLGAYEAIFRLPGVETATASFQEGLVTARIDPNKVDKNRLEMALKERGVQLKMAE